MTIRNTKMHTYLFASMSFWLRFPPKNQMTCKNMKILRHPRWIMNINRVGLYLLYFSYSMPSAWWPNYTSSATQIVLPLIKVLSGGFNLNMPHAPRRHLFLKLPVQLNFLMYSIKPLVTKILCQLCKIYKNNFIYSP